MKQSQAFAAFRTSLITDKNHAILTELAPMFNSECEDIRRRVEKDFETYHNQAKSDNLKKSLVYDLVLGRKQTLAEVQNSMAKSITERLERDGATIRKDVEDGDYVKNVQTAIFPDGSMARVPQSLWIDYSVFDRV